MQMYDLPDARGHFGPYGGSFVAETLVHALAHRSARHGGKIRGHRKAAKAVDGEGLAD